MTDNRISNVKIESDGTYSGTRVIVDGVLIKGVRSMNLRFDQFDHQAEVDLEVIAPKVNMEGPAYVEVTEVQPDEFDDKTYEEKSND